MVVSSMAVGNESQTPTLAAKNAARMGRPVPFHESRILVESIQSKPGLNASDGLEEIIMGKLAIWAQLEAKAGKEKELEEFLKSAQPLAEREPGTVTWYAIKMGQGKYGIFDTFADENGRNAHLNGEIAKALFAKAKDLLASPPKIDKPEVLASKTGRG
jgi:quinol monooxygenase YgiN